MSADDSSPSVSTIPAPVTLREDFERLKEKVLEVRPFLRQVLQGQGNKSLFEYAKGYFEINMNPPIQKRQDEFVAVFKEEVKRRLGDKIAESAGRQLYHYYYANTADHLAIIDAPWQLNCHLLSAIAYKAQKDKALNNVIVLPCANVTINNAPSYPRGLLFDTYVDGQLKLNKLPILPANSRLPVYGFRPYMKEEIEKAKNFAQDLVKKGEFQEDKAIKLSKILDEIFLAEDVLKCENFPEQLTKVNFSLWKKFFEGSKMNMPNLIYIEQETLVAKLLANYHVYEDTIINHMIFDETYEPLIRKYFAGVVGAFSESGKYGTYLFWGMPKGEKHRISLRKEGNMLVSDESEYKLELTPDNVKEALLEGELIPSLLVTFTVLSFYYGVKCLGAFNQVNYLSEMKNNYIKMNVDRGNYRSIEVCSRAQTREMGGDLIFAFLEGVKGEMVPATGIDLLLYGQPKMWDILMDECKEITLEEALNPIMPENYKIAYKEEERTDEALNKITPEDVTRVTHLDAKIRPCAKI